MAVNIDELSNKEKKLLKILIEENKIGSDHLAELTTKIALLNKPIAESINKFSPINIKVLNEISDFSIFSESTQNSLRQLENLNPQMKETLEKISNMGISNNLYNFNNEKIQEIFRNFPSQDLEKSAKNLIESQKSISDFWVQQAFLLNEKKLATVERNVKSSYVLSDEGKKYLKDGLPERQLLNSFNTEIELNQLKNNPLSNVGIGWMRKKGWVTIKDGILIKNESNPADGEDEKALRSIQNQEPISDIKQIKELIKRGLVIEQQDVKNYFQLPENFFKFNISNLDIESDKKIGTLTRDQIISGDWRNLKLRKYDVSKLPKKAYPGKIHPYQRIIGEMREILLEMGFTELYGGIVQQSYWNFDALFQPQDHPAREMQDTFYLNETLPLPKGYEKVKAMHMSGGETSSTGWGGVWKEEKAEQCVLRTHTTSVSIQYLANNPNPPVKAFCVGRVYRRETIDTTHLAEFEQLEGIVMDEGVTFGNLLGILREFYHRMGFEGVRFKPSYYPYTEPSLDAEVFVDGIGWIEMGGAGVFREEVTAPLGINYPVLAWGLGVSRIAMLRLGLKDLRYLHKSDVAFLRETPSLRHTKGGI
jgi:phenylalanyl-tRNA synthetase alpha chain